MPRRRLNLKVESQYEIDIQSRSRRLIGTSLRDGDECEIKKMPTAENVRGLSQKP